ncbi:hypothetical protein KUCAC02_000187, partial [Chaenocephalus aceratus]
LPPKAAFSYRIETARRCQLGTLPGSTLVSALSHLCQLHDFHDLGRQEYYTATWKEANTWTQLTARLSHNAAPCSASTYNPPTPPHPPLIWLQVCAKEAEYHWKPCGAAQSQPRGEGGGKRK